jgi:hypothetical protein
MAHHQYVINVKCHLPGHSCKLSSFLPLAHFAQVTPIHSIVHAALQVCNNNSSVNALRHAINDGWYVINVNVFLAGLS